MTSSWIPVQMDIDRSEYFFNKGILRVGTVDAKLTFEPKVVSPSVFFVLDDELIAKKRLPHGNYVPPGYDYKRGFQLDHLTCGEYFEVLISSCLAAELAVEIRTYDTKIGLWITLGSSKADLMLMKPYSPTHRRLDFEGMDDGYLRLRLWFQPQYIHRKGAKTKQRMSDWSGINSLYIVFDSHGICDYLVVVFPSLVTGTVPLGLEEVQSSLPAKTQRILY
ncbi:hypothetical protein QBC44DRAFT_404414 [Cladorrhinum sp. PSN332]|nr:hypothetical protein QBC44DRAFT_404414 [Cladorrhinum sp. PSN332]